jgi:hypothetical protein
MERIFRVRELTTKEILEVREITAVIFPIAATLRFLPGVYASRPAIACRPTPDGHLHDVGGELSVGGIRRLRRGLIGRDRSSQRVPKAPSV